MGNGYFSNSFGNRMIASHCSPVFVDLRPVKLNKRYSSLRSALGTKLFTFVKLNQDRISVLIGFIQEVLVEYVCSHSHHVDLIIWVVFCSLNLKDWESIPRSCSGSFDFTSFRLPAAVLVCSGLTVGTLKWIKQNVGKTLHVFNLRVCITASSIML